MTIGKATATDVVESFALLSEDLLSRRHVPADGGVWYGICPTGATCPYPARRLARAAIDLVPRRLALELALRTFLETDATVVAVSLPTPRLVAVVVERQELAADVSLRKLARALRVAPLLDPGPTIERITDELTRPRTYLFLGFEPGPAGGPSWAGVPRWPNIP